MARGVGRTPAGNSVDGRPCVILPHWCLCALRKCVFMLHRDKWMMVPSHVDGALPDAPDYRGSYGGKCNRFHWLRSSGPRMARHSSLSRMMSFVDGQRRE